MTTEQNPREKGVNVARLVDRLSKDISMMSAPSSNHSAAAAAAAANNAPKGDVHLRKAHQNQIVSTPQQQHSPHKQPQHGRGVVACFSYSAQMDDELDLREGDQIDVLEEVEDGWARGEITSSAHAAAQGRVGLFPTNFVLPISTGTPNNGAPKTAPPTSSKVKEMAKVIYNYEAANPDELSLPEGALVTVLNKNCEDDGWYEGELNGRRGLFPENFVKLLQPAPADAATGAAAPTSPTVSEKALLSATPAQPPTLPAKPKTTSQRASAHVTSSTNHSAAPPVARFRDSAFAWSTATSSASGGTSHSSDATNSAREKSPVSAASPAAAKIAAASDERKSMVAGLQSLLFPQGKLPPVPHKSPAAAAASADKDDAVDESRLSSLTKNRPKQSNKRPPSLSVRQSVLQPKVTPEDSSPTSQSTLFPSSSSTGSIASAKVPSSPGIASSKSPKTLPLCPTLPAAPTASKPSNSLDSVAKQKTNTAVETSSSSAVSATTTAGEAVSREEFDAFRQETTHKIDELTRQVADLTMLLKNSQK